MSYAQDLSDSDDDEAQFGEDSSEEELLRISDGQSDEDGDGDGDEDDDGDGDADADGDADSDESDTESDEGMDEDSPDDASEREMSLDRADVSSSPVVLRQRDFSPSLHRREAFKPSLLVPKAYNVDAIIALPHPEGQHAIASSLCMTHFLTGSEDGFIRDYDIFASANSQGVLTAQQRSYIASQDTNLKGPFLRSWWENPSGEGTSLLQGSRSPIYSLAVQSDALWGLSGSKDGRINLFTVRHDPGRMHHVFAGSNGHNDSVSSMCLTADESGFLSAGWDGHVVHWDLNTGQTIRKYPSHGSQLVTVALRPLNPLSNQWFADRNDDGHAEPEISESRDGPDSAPPERPAAQGGQNIENGSASEDADGDTDNGYDPLFDDDMDTAQSPQNLFSDGLDRADSIHPMNSSSLLQMPGTGANAANRRRSNNWTSTNRVPNLDSAKFSSFSQDVFLSAGVDGQICIWDQRQSSGNSGVGILGLPEKTPPWCMSASWTADGSYVFAGRRNGTVDIWDMRYYGPDAGQGQPKIFRVLKNPTNSGPVVCVAGFPDSRHIVCASEDNIRLWNIFHEDANDNLKSNRSQSAHFRIIPGNHGTVSQILIDPSAKFMVTASGNRGWWGETSRSVLVHSVISTA